MPTVIKMPKLSDTMTEGTLLKWNIQKGDSVEMGQIIAEVETDKATMEMEAFDDGIVHELYAAAGDKVAVGARMAVLLADGEDASAADNLSDDAPAEAPAAAEEAAPATSAAAPAAAPTSAPAAAAPAPAIADADVKIKISPLARKIAKAEGVALAALQGRGTGPGGRVTKADVLKAIEEGATAAPAAAPAAGAAPAATSALPTILPTVGEEDEVVPLSTMRKIIADRLLASKTQLPHFYLRVEIDAAPMMELRKQINASEAQRENGNKFSVNDFVLKAVVGAAQAVGDINASFNGDSIVKFAKVGLSVAVAVDDGLVTPVIKDAANKSLVEISKAVKDLAVRARDKKLKPDEFDGGTITVSNLGAWGIDHFDAIVNPPQAAIVSVGAIKQKPVVVNGELAVGTRMWIGLSADHRVVDGAVAATYLQEVVKRLESPALMLV
ncbi:dihydrolipoamide acetyltransferase family protein [Sulfuriroseicoccus oceanibius]|uniref:Dihydrolipoamide acetyltransferase component of pyruvate dehydrogenase complex n=1 Tax=Sulfuriroseicoccus oceanibius TaxID=2707525 RepID=A0A6B3LBF1_9BACT|nr:dihydrolipoamide acetyltransferase family protein [Sulfuriroseicoccus oceanibius]QQL45362.1 2-oxo acid dehydrogenase subunit E2 [Sulfuriroseicoccus oceanibius]